MKSQLSLLFGLLLTFGLICPLISQAAETELLLRENLKQAKAGDYLVTAQNKSYTVLLIRNKEADHLSIEEITVPAKCIGSNKSFSWRRWVEGGAKGNTSWIMYNIYIPTGTIQQTFSFSRNEWITIPQAQNFLSTLLNLRLSAVPFNKRKKMALLPILTARIDAPYGSRALWLRAKSFLGQLLMPGVLTGQRMAANFPER